MQTKRGCRSHEGSGISSQNSLDGPCEKVDESEILVVTPGEKQNGDVSKQYQNREDLEKAYNEAKESEALATPKRIIDTIPALAWCNLSDGSNEFVNQRWSDYTGLSQEEVKRRGV